MVNDSSALLLRFTCFTLKCAIQTSEWTLSIVGGVGRALGRGLCSPWSVSEDSCGCDVGGSARLMLARSHAVAHPPHPLISHTTLLCLQVFAEGPDAVKQSLEGVFDDAVPDGKVKINARVSSEHTADAPA